MTESRDSWDAIVIGSGLGGLAAGAALAGRGKRVLVLERLANFGGAATIYRHGAMTMEASLHETDGDTVNSPNGLFARLGVRSAIEPVPTDIFYEARWAGLPRPVRIPHGLDETRAALIEAFPEARRGLDRYCDEVKSLHAALQDLEEMGSRGPSVLIELLFSGRLFKLIGDSQRTLAQVMTSYLGEHEGAKIALGGPLAYFDDDPARTSFLLYAGVWSRYVEAGSYYLKGGSLSLTLALLARIHQAGGDARRTCTVEHVLLDEQGRATGAAYVDRDGQHHEVRAPIVLGNASPQGIAGMLPDGFRKTFESRYAGFEPSISLFNAFVGLDRPASEFGVTAYSTFVFPDHMKRFNEFPEAAAAFGQATTDRMPPYVIADYGRLATGLQREGDLHAVSICGPDHFATWSGLDEAGEKARRQLWLDALIRDVDRWYPGFASAVKQSEIATARTMKTRLGTPHGEVYGFRPTPARLFHRPPSPITTIPGLLLASAYTVSGGYTGAMQGGVMAADAALLAERRRRR